MYVQQNCLKYALDKSARSVSIEKGKKTQSPLETKDLRMK